MLDLHPGSARTRSTREVTEELRGGRIPLRANPEWVRAFPWVVQGTTVRRPVAPRPGHAQSFHHRTDHDQSVRGQSVRSQSVRGQSVRGQSVRSQSVRSQSVHDRTGCTEDEDLDFGLFTGAPAGAAMQRWELLAEGTGCGSVVHARQVHGCEIALHGATPPGLLLVPPCDGHATRQPGTLLAVSVADCVPIFVVAPRVRAVMLLHAGWRGVASGILEAGLAMLESRLGAHAPDTHIHMGPAICGRCYEVGGEVHEALGLPRPAFPALPVDLRRVLADRALASGADPAHVTISTFCTRCADTPFFSHRGGDAGRQIAVLGITPEGPAPEAMERLGDNPREQIQ